ncbi:MAG TPA: M14 family metallopeptidase [Pyrinomonadaceae bacterium]|nr:M14 family metallopeptidase [Pyrinomonadaceae bacterium]
MRSFLPTLRLCVVIVLAVYGAFAQIPAPKDVIGFTPGDDRKLASWASIVDYFKKLDAASDRVMFEEIGKTTMGAPFVYATISSPENLKQLEKYKQINAKLADPRLIKSNPAIAKKLIAEGKTIVLITCGIHSTEVGSTLSSMLIAHQLALAPHPDVKKVLDNTIILLVPSLNPDGVDIVKNWYDKTLGTPFEGTEPPELYHKYVGHDNNRDWYAFTQVETQLTVDKIHNVWHPQIVHDIHQQGARGSRLFLPPYMQPVEPNVPKQIVEGYTELGNAMAAKMRQMGYQGITTNSTYDAWTPARAYSHYHGGVRILSETASARLASPITVKFDELRVSSDDGYDPKVESANFGPVWKGGEWKLRNITDYMTLAAHTLLMHASDNREKWLSRFYEIGKEAVRPKDRKGELYGYRVEVGDNFPTLKSILERGGVEYGFPKGGKPTVVKDLSYIDTMTTYPSDFIVVPMSQPYGAFAKALLENQTYPDLKDNLGNPISPYDVTAHGLSPLTHIAVEELRSPFRSQFVDKIRNVRTLTDCLLGQSDKIGLYRSSIPSMDEGWTRWVFEKRGACSEYEPVSNRDISKDRLYQRRPPSGTEVPYKVVLFPDQPPAQILNGYAKGSMPDEYTGGVGKEGVENLKKFVEAGGTLVFLNRSTEFAIEQFNLPIRNVVKGLDRKQFYIPGSILRTELDTTHPIAKGMPQPSIAWFENSPVFEEVRVTPSGVNAPGDITPKGVTLNMIAKYPTDPKNILLSGWALGAEKIAGKAALVEVTMGKGKIILFGFRPQYRGQSLATFPLLFNAISQ